MNKNLNQLQEILDIAGVILVVLNTDESIALINKKGCDTLGFTREELIGKSYFDNFIEEAHRDQLKFVFKQIIKGELDGSASYENKVLTKSGCCRIIKWSNSFLKDSQGNIIATISSGEDVTEERKKQAFAAAVNDRLADIIITTSLKGEIQYVSDSVTRLLGFDTKELIGKILMDYVHPDDKVPVMERWMDMLRNRDKMVYSRHRLVTKEGDYKWIEGEARNMHEDENIQGVLNNFRDITERMSIEERFRVLFDQSVDGLMIVDTTGIIDCNGAVVRMLKAKNKSEILGKKPSFFSPPFQQNNKQIIDKTYHSNKLAKEKRFHRFDWVHQTLQGNQFNVEVSITPLYSLGKDMMLVSWHDLSERKMFENKLLEAKEKAEAATKSHEQFLSTMSHEIRTPLNAIIGLSHILIDEKPRENQMENLQTLQFSSQHLLSLVNDILDFSKIEAGGIELEKASFSLGAMLGGIQKSMQAKAREQGIEISVLKDPMLPEYVMGDSLRLAQVLNNLVGNAVKFTNHGSVQIQVESGHRNGEEVEVSFTIKDTGIGIPEDKLPYIFDQFSQANSDTTRKFGGTGLGLAISKKLVKIMGSDLKVKSRLGVGSEFFFKIKFQAAKNLNYKLEKVERQDQFSPLNIHVLLVEDNRINQVVIGKFLRRWGVKVDIADNGCTGVEMAKNYQYDLMLMDLQMPDMDGFETTRLIRGNGYNGPIVALTATVLFDIKKKVLASGMNDIMGKPFKPQELYEKIKTLTVAGGFCSKFQNLRKCDADRRQE